MVVADFLFRAQFQGRLASGALVRNSLHYWESTELLENRAPLSEVADHLDTKLTATYLALNSTDYHLDTLEVRSVVRTWAPYFEIPEVYAKNVSSVGGSAPSTDRLPDGMTAKISIKSDAAIRGGHGWLLLPGSPAGSSLSSVAKWESGYLTNIQALAALLDDQVSWGTLPVHTLSPVVYSRKRHQENAENFFFRVTGATASSTPGWLRRRMTIP